MKILWFTWKDLQNPQAGGAERVNEELAKRLVRNGHEIVFLTAGFPGAEPEEVSDGYIVIRRGGRWTVYWQAYRFYKEYLEGWPDVVIDEINTVPFFSKFYCKERNLLLVHQLCRQIWFYQMFFPLSAIGYLLEPVYLRLLSDRRVVTVSPSTRQDLIGMGFKKENIEIISTGIDLEPIDDLAQAEKYPVPTVLSFGSVRAMKRTDHALRAFAIAKEKEPALRLIVAGDYDNPFGRKVLLMAKESRYAKDIEFLGKVDQEKKTELLRRSHLLLVNSIKEGWGLVVTEANSQGTPAIVYDVDGLRDSVRPDETGIICGENTPENMADDIIGLLRDKEKYDRLRRGAWRWSREINFENGVRQFENIIRQ